MTPYFINVSIHILAALVWLGGMFFFALVGAPVLRKVPSPELRAQLFAELGTRFRAVGWIAILTLLITGVMNLQFRGFLSVEVLGAATFWQTAYGRALMWKLCAVAIMLVVQAIHDFIHGPAAVRLTPGTPEALRMRRRAAWLARINALVGLVVLLAAVKLARP